MSLERVGRVLAGVEPPELLEVVPLDVKEPRNGYEALGALFVAVLSGDEEEAYKFAKKFYESHIAGEPNVLAASLTYIARRSEERLRAFLLLMASVIAAKAASPVIYEVREAADSTQCDGECAAYLSATYSHIYKATFDPAAYERAWAFFERSGEYKPLAALWIPVLDEGDLERLREASAMPVEPIALELLGVSEEELRRKLTKRLELSVADFNFIRFLETGDLSHAEAVLRVQSNEDVVKTLRGKVLAMLGRLMEARREFAKASGERAKYALAAADAFLGKKVRLVQIPDADVFLRGVAVLTNYVILALQGRQPGYVAEEVHVVDIAANAVADIARGRRPERLAVLADLYGFKWLYEAVMTSDRRDALRLLYFALA